VLITHSLRDTHHDHRAIAASTIEAGRFVPNILSYEIPLSDIRLIELVPRKSYALKITET
jgi:hypothetical protein